MNTMKTADLPWQMGGRAARTENESQDKLPIIHSWVSLFWFLAGCLTTRHSEAILIQQHISPG